MNLDILRCPQCSGALISSSSGYRCGQCDAAYAHAHGVPILITGVSAEPSNFVLSDDLINHVLKQENIPDEIVNRARLKDIFSTNYRLSDMLLTAENNFYLQRIGLKIDGYRSQEASGGLAESGRVEYDMPSHMIPPVLPPQELRSWNVRLENTGERTLVCQGEGAFFLTYRLTDVEGRVWADGSVRTALPVDIPAGRGITIPLWISPPESSGHYVVDIRLDQEERAWAALDKIRTEIEVRPDWGSMVPAHWLTLHRLPETYNYQIDHEIGRVFLKEEIARFDHPIQRVLEIGGCCNPMTWDLPCEVISADIDVQTLQVGALHFSKFRPNVEFLAADAHRLPFADGVFDCAVMFATLHHFLDPAACLKELMRVVREGGFVTILCEPIGSYHAETLSAEFKADLEQGINEQIFTPEEYGHIFARAGVEATRAVIDGGSFKAILRRRSSDPQAAMPAPPLAAVDAALGAPSQSWLANRLKAIFSRS